MRNLYREILPNSRAFRIAILRARKVLERLPTYSVVGRSDMINAPINFREKKPEFRFKMVGGLCSVQPQFFQ